MIAICCQGNCVPMVVSKPLSGWLVRILNFLLWKLVCRLHVKIRLEGTQSPFWRKVGNDFAFPSLRNFLQNIRSRESERRTSVSTTNSNLWKKTTWKGKISKWSYILWFDSQNNCALFGRLFLLELVLWYLHTDLLRCKYRLKFYLYKNKKGHL